MLLVISMYAGNYNVFVTDFESTLALGTTPNDSIKELGHQTDVIVKTGRYKTLNLVLKPQVH